MRLPSFGRNTGAGLVAVCLLTAPARAADAPPLELVQTIKLTGPVGKKLEKLALDAKGNRLFVANQANSSLDVIDLKQGKVVKSVAGQDGIQGVLYLPGVDRVVATLGAGGCIVFDGDTFKVVKSLTVPNADNIRTDPTGALIYVTQADKKIALFDAKSFEAKGAIALPTAPESFVFETGRPRLYVNGPVPRQVLVVDAAKKEVLKKHTLENAGNYPLALDEANHRLFVGCRKEPVLAVHDTETGKEVASVAIPNDVDDVFYDAKRKRLYASCGEGFVVVLKQDSADRYSLLGKLATAKQARTSLFDPETGRLFVALARQADKENPEIRVYQARP
jgi:DNA-binding beta-propeller fold protein YncE